MTDRETMAMNRIVYSAEVAAKSRDGKQVRIVRRRENGPFKLESPQHIVTLDVDQANELRESLEEAIRDD